MTFTRTLIVALVMLTAFVQLRFQESGSATDLIRPLKDFPETIGEWQGRAFRFDDRVYQVLGVDDSFSASYTGPEGRLVDVYIGYYRSQEEGEMAHSPKVCMPGSGWQVVRTEAMPLSLPGSRYDKRKVVRLTTENAEEEKQIVLYWFHSRGRIISSEYLQRFYLAVDSITRHRTDGGFVRLIVTVKKGDEEAAIRQLNSFMQDFFPALDQYLPT